MFDVAYVALTIATFAVFALVVKGVELLTADDIVGLVVALVLTVYLVVALLKPERF